MTLQKHRNEINRELAASLCKTSFDHLEQCYISNYLAPNMPCYNREQCRIAEKSNKQIKYIFSPVNGHMFLEACPGSGKTEVVGFKAAYEMQRWERQFFGMAVLTFTNTAAKEIQERVRSLTVRIDNYPHFIGTFDSWLHSFLVQPFGHQVVNRSRKKNDLTFRLIEDRRDLHFLNSFKVWPRIKGRPLLANEYTWDPYSECFYSQSRGVRTILDSPKWDSRRLEKTKYNLWRAGFFTYNDADAISYLLSKEVGRRLATRFPYIIVDECQDLSPCKLGILQLLAEQGSQIHLVGDLSQSIFGFTGAEPEKTLGFVNDLNFTKEKLSQNYRSLQPIVDISCAIFDQSDGPIFSCSSSERDSNVVVFEYPDVKFMADIPGKYMEFLKEKDISVDESVILARGHSTLKRLGASVLSSRNNNVIMLANACYQWFYTDSLFKRDLALDQFGRFIYNIFFEDVPLAGYRTYSCPEGYSLIQWRLLLSSILESIKSSPEIADLEQDWSNWLKSVKAFFRKDVCLAKGWPENKLISLRSPNGEKDKAVNHSIDKHSTQLPVRATTIHDIKGETVGAALLVSSPDRRGSNGGHWTDWLSGNDPEHARFAYVASSRPVHTLAWAVPKLAEDQRRQILELGFDEIIQW